MYSNTTKFIAMRHLFGARSRLLEGEDKSKGESKSDIKTSANSPILVTLAFALVSMLILTACGDTDDIDRDAPVITVTSHDFGEDVTGSQDTTIAGTVSPDTSSLTVQLNDTDPVSVTPVEEDFSTDLTLALGENTIVIEAKDETGNSRTTTYILYFPFLQLENDQAASVVIGQSDFDVNDVNQGNADPANNTLNQVNGAPSKTDAGVLYLPDSGNNRILGYSVVPTDNDGAASSVIGQIDFNTNVAGTSATKLSAPSGFVTTDTQYFAVDSANHRVLIWSAFPNREDVEASIVLGQLDFDSAIPGCGVDKLSSPSSIIVVDDKLILSDSGNNRVLIWNEIPVLDEFGVVDIAADVVIGQQNMDFCVSNDADGDGIAEAAPSASTLSSVGDIWSDGERLLVADTDNHRILVWNTFPTNNGQAADRVLGQLDMNTATPSLSQSGLSAPKSVYSNGNQIFVADSGNERVLIWDLFPTADNASADRVIGQVDFVSKETGSISDTRMASYDSLFADRQHLMVVDGNRVLIFQEPEVP